MTLASLPSHGRSDSGVGNSPVMGSVSVPADPSSLSTTGGDSTVSLSWTDNADNEDGYKVYRSTTQGFTPGSGNLLTDGLGANTTSYTDSTASNDTTYYYRVKAFNSGGDSGASNEASATPTATPAADWVEDYSTYSSTTEYRNDINDWYTANEDTHIDEQYLDTSHGLDVDGYNLAQSCRYDYHQNWGHPGRNTEEPASDQGEIWIEVYMKKSLNFKTDWGVADKNPDYKWIFGRTRGGRHDIHLGLFGDNYAFSNCGDFNTGVSSLDHSDMTWRRYRFHWKVPSSDGATDGSAEMWIDDNKIVECIDNWDGGADQSALIWSIALGRNMNEISGVNEVISLYWGRVALWWSQDPGWI